MIKKSLVSYYEKNHRRRYIAEDPEKITKLLEEKLTDFNQILPDLKGIYNRLSNKPKIRFFEGAEGIKDIYREILKVNEILAIASPNHIERALGNFFQNFVNKMLEKNIIARELITWDGYKANYIKRYDQRFQQTRLLPEEVKISTDMIFYQNKLAMISYTSDLHAVVIESSSIIQTQKAMFKIIWQTAEKINL